MRYECIEEGYGIEFEQDVLKSLQVYREALDVAFKAHATAAAWCRRGQPVRARRALLKAARHCRVLGVLPWALNVASRRGVMPDAANSAWWAEDLGRRLRGDLAPEYLRDKTRWGLWRQEAADRLAERACVRDRTLWVAA